MQELWRAATDRLPQPVSEYFNQGSADGITTCEAVAAWDRVRFRPRVLRDVSAISTATSVLGQQLATPVCVAPTTLHRAAHADGEVATARGAVAAGSLMAVSSNAGVTFEQIGATGAAWWLQCYVLRDRGLTRAIAQRARAAGASAVILTADTPVVGRKHSTGPSVWDVVPADYLLANIDQSDLPDAALDKADDLTPDTIGWLSEVSGLPVVVKGVLRADDARIVTSAGAAAVQVSNHGGRQLDQSVATADALPLIAAAVEGTGAEIYVDGGIRRGEHVLAALALGARAVFVGRPVLWALAAGGEAGQGGCGGVADLLGELTDELRHAMTLAGARTVSEITRDLVA
ncbi:MAG TPA: alpha-hydroxy acid oxidase [Streptosporangiaceae bacterium]|nr:alpha-hydroxy acid oxidase [Streptosporangiaceae bacterium]